MDDICLKFLYNILLYCGGLDQAMSQMSMLVAFTLVNIFAEDFNKTVKLRFLYGLG